MFYHSIYRCRAVTLPLRNGNLTFEQQQGYPCAAVNNFISYKTTKLLAIFQLLRCEIILLIPLSWDCIFAEGNRVSNENDDENDDENLEITPSVPFALLTALVPLKEGQCFQLVFSVETIKQELSPFKGDE